MSIKTATPTDRMGPPQCEAHWAGDTKKCLSPAKRRPGLAAPPRRPLAGEGDCRALPRPAQSLLARQSCLRGRRFPQEPAFSCARIPACSSCLRGKLQGRPGEWPSPNVPQAGPGAGWLWVLRSGREVGAGGRGARARRGTRLRVPKKRGGPPRCCVLLPVSDCSALRLCVPPSHCFSSGSDI